MEIKFNEDTEWILGRPNFWCGNLARRLREKGMVIREHEEEEQAAVIYYLLSGYAKHGEKWRDEINKDLKSDEKIIDPRWVKQEEQQHGKN